VLRLGLGSSPNIFSLPSWRLRAIALIHSPILLGSGIASYGEKKQITVGPNKSATQKVKSHFSPNPGLA